MRELEERCGFKIAFWRALAFQKGLRAIGWWGPTFFAKGKEGQRLTSTSSFLNSSIYLHLFDGLQVWNKNKTLKSPELNDLSSFELQNVMIQNKKPSLKKSPQCEKHYQKFKTGGRNQISMI